MTRYVLDTNIVSFIVKRDTGMVTRFQTEITPEDVIIGCPMVWYEAQRGLYQLSKSPAYKIFQYFKQVLASSTTIKIYASLFGSWY